MTLLTKMIKHFKLVMRHKYYVFMASIEAGIPFRGLFHDMSKFSPIEFFNSIKYYTGDRSPIDNEKDEKGYSYAWLHHRGHNPHHWEYWIDNLSSGGEALKMPSKYVKEMICDWIGSGKAYNKANWTVSTPYDFFINRLKKGQIKMHPHTEAVCVNILETYKNYEDANLREVLKLWINQYEKCGETLSYKITMPDVDSDVEVYVTVASSGINTNRRVYDSELFNSTMKDVKDRLQNAAETCMKSGTHRFDDSDTPGRPYFVDDKLVSISYPAGTFSVNRPWGDIEKQIREIKSRGIDITERMYNDIIHSKNYEDCWKTVYEYKEGKRQ